MCSSCCSAAAVAAIADQPAQSEKRLIVQSMSLNEHVAQLDGQWQCARLASNGKVYFASSTHAHDHGAAFFQYDPTTGALMLLCEDITPVCGEDPKRQVPQGKIHSDLVECGGQLYFATHLANDWDQGRANYTGAHLLRYDLRSGQFGDLGLLRSQHTCYAGLAIDPAGRWAYNHVCSWDKSYAGGAGIVRTDLATGHRLDLGDAPGLGKASCFYLFADSRGDCWFAKQGRLFAARAAEGKIDVFDRAMQNVPALDAAGNITPQPAYGWEWGQDIGDGQRFICTLMRTERETLETLYEFDPRKVASGQSPFRPIAHIGQTNLGMALGGQRVYFVRRDDGQRQPKGENHHLHSVAWTGPCAGQVIDHGRILDQDGRWPWRVESMAADANGRVFLIGDWYLLKDEREQVLPGERRRQSLRLPEKWAPQDPPQYDRLFRGQFFAAADVSKDLP